MDRQELHDLELRVGHFYWLRRMGSSPCLVCLLEERGDRLRVALLDTGDVRWVRRESFFDATGIRDVTLRRYCQAIKAIEYVRELGKFRQMVTLRLPIDWHLELLERAEAAGCSLNAYCLAVLRLAADPDSPVLARPLVESSENETTKGIP